MLVFIERHIHFVRDITTWRQIFYNTKIQNLWRLGNQQIPHQVGFKIVITCIIYFFYHKLLHKKDKI